MEIGYNTFAEFVCIQNWNIWYNKIVKRGDKMQEVKNIRKKVYTIDDVNNKIFISHMFYFRKNYFEDI